MRTDYDDSAQERWLAEAGVDLYRGQGTIAGPGKVDVGERRLTARHIVVASGSDR